MRILKLSVLLMTQFLSLIYGMSGTEFGHQKNHSISTNKKEAFLNQLEQFFKNITAMSIDYRPMNHFVTVVSPDFQTLTISKITSTITEEVTITKKITKTIVETDIVVEPVTITTKEEERKDNAIIKFSTILAKDTNFSLTITSVPDNNILTIGCTSVQPTDKTMENLLVDRKGLHIGYKTALAHSIYSRSMSRGSIGTSESPNKVLSTPSFYTTTYEEIFISVKTVDGFNSVPSSIPVLENGFNKLLLVDDIKLKIPQVTQISGLRVSNNPIQVLSLTQNHRTFPFRNNIYSFTKSKFNYSKFINNSNYTHQSHFIQRNSGCQTSLSLTEFTLFVSTICFIWLCLCL